MSEFEKKYTERFKDQQSTDGVDVDGLWAAVNSQLDQDQGGLRRSIIFKRSLLFIGLVLCTLGSVYLFKTDSIGRNSVGSLDSREGEVITQSSSVSSQNKSATRKSNPNQDAKKGLVFLSDDEKPSQIEIEQLKSIKDSSANETRRTRGTGGISPQRSSKKSLGQGKQTNQNPGGFSQGKLDKKKKGNEANLLSHQGTGLKMVKSNKKAHPDKTVEKDSSGQLAGTWIKKSLAHDKSSTGSDMKPDAERSAGSGQTPNPPDSDLVIDDKAGLVREPSSIQFMQGMSQRMPSSPSLSAKRLIPAADYYRNRLQWKPAELYLGLGLNKMQALDQHGSPQVSDDYFSTTTAKTGYSARFRATWIGKDRMRLSTGIDIDVMRTTFDYTAQKEGLQVTEERVIGVSTDSLGVQTLIYGPLTFDATQSRVVHHNNDYQLISIPLELGVQKYVGRRMTLGMDVGLSFGMYISQRGRSVNAIGEVTSFDSPSEMTVPFKRTQLCLHARPLVDYQVTDRLAIRLSPMLRYLDSPLKEHRGNVFIWSASSGLVYSLP